ncbi:MAG: diacylglycerol/lipid kinase family protein [Actinomycetota bacterium]
MRVLLLVNATASSVTPRRRSRVRRALAARHEVEVAETSRRGHATRLAHAAARDGFDVVAVYGGDGTLNEAAEGLLHSETAVAPIPGGSTNVYARTLGYPNDAIRAVETAVTALDRGTFKRVGVGRANGRPFLFNTGIGFDAAVVRRVERHPRLKRWAAHPAYVGAALGAVFGGEATRMCAEVETDAGPAIEGARFVVVSKTDPYTFLGPRPIRIAPEAGLARGLAVTAFRSFGPVTLVGGACSAMGSGRFLAGRRGIEHRSDATRIVVRAGAPFPYQVDGEDLGDTDRVELVHEPEALRVLLP